MVLKKNLIFSKDDLGNLKFIGNFEELYQIEDDPWEQSSNDGDRGKYYKRSRDRLIKKLKTNNSKEILEIGSGLGVVSDFISKNLTDSICEGLEISPTAVKKARGSYPNLSFHEGDITSENFKLNKVYDIVILNQLLWYISYKIPQVIDNCKKILKKDGCIIFSQAFLKTKQLYAKDIIDGFSGTTNYLKKIIPEDLVIVDQDFDNNESFIFNDGIIVIKKLKRN